MSQTSAEAEMAYQYQKMVRAEIDAGREVPAKAVPAALGDLAKGSVDASQRLYRKAQSRTFTMPVSLAELEAKRAAKAKAAKAASKPAKPATKKTGAKKARAKGSR